MHPTHDWSTGLLARERAAEARARAVAHRLEVAAGLDLHTRVVDALGVLLDRHRAADVGRRARAATALRAA